MIDYASPFDQKAELRKISEKAKTITDPKVRKAMVEAETKELQAHAEMLKRMSRFVNAKNKNSAGNGQHRTSLR